MVVVSLKLLSIPQPPAVPILHVLGPHLVSVEEEALDFLLLKLVPLPSLVGIESLSQLQISLPPRLKIDLPHQLGP